ncbi:Holliday junction resolvase RecU [Cytobacillus sp. IB215665]|uniref:Holliday junction resolvase RecU n=1 Tax=Cytobacillus sp. IB215665 TaxID=3097357 RepID=UPI0039B78BFC
MIRYPNGKLYKEKQDKDTNTAKKASYSNRGMTLEEDINDSNNYYLLHNIAVIHKKPTPVQIVQVDYPKRSAAVIKEAYFKQASTTDYNGIYKGRYIDFEAKETRNKTSFPLQNFHDHQIKHMRDVINHNGLCFVILRFTKNEQIFLLDATHLLSFWDRMKKGDRKSITKQEIVDLGHEVPLGYKPRIDYLNILDNIYFS